MTPADVVGRLVDQGVQLWTEGDRLRFKAPQGVLQAADTALLREHKQGIVELLQGRLAMRLSNIQKRLWFLTQWDPEGLSYSLYFAYTITGCLDVPRLGQSVQQVVNRHAALRATCTSLGGYPVQMIAPTVTVPTALSVLPSGQSAAEIQQAMRTAVVRPFDLQRGPLARSHLFRTAEEEHIWILSLHHLIADGWSFGLLIAEVNAAYAGQDIPTLPAEYADYLEHERHQAARANEDLAYWRAQLDSAPVLQLLPDKPRPAVRTYHGRQQVFEVSPAATTALRTLCRHSDTTLFVGLLTAFSTLLHWHTGQHDLVVGTPYAARDEEKFAALIACMVRTVVLRADLSGAPTFRELLLRMQQCCLDAYTYLDVSFETLVTELEPQRDLSRSPLFQVFFALQNAYQSLCLPGLHTAWYWFEAGLTQFDLECHVQEEAEGLKGMLLYNADLFSPSTMAAMAQHFTALIECLAAAPDTCVTAAALLTPAERARLLVEWNTTQALVPHEACLHTLLEEQAVRTPGRVAVVCDGAELTYQELHCRADVVAHHLRQHGIGRQHRVGLLVERSLAMVIGLLGILKAGAAFVPLDPRFPAERLRYMIADSEIQLICTQVRLVDTLPTHITPVLLDALADEALAASPSSFPAVLSDDIAYMMYTSGSTGRPKGVLIPHAAVVNCLTAMRQAPGLTDANVLLAITTLSFDIAILELLLPLLVGAKLIIAGEGVAADARQLMRLLETSEADVIQATPATYKFLSSAGWRGNDRLKVLCGGEALSPDLARELVRTCGEVWNLYGPTEATIWAARARVSGDGAVVIGRPIENTRFYVLNDRREPVPVGVPGELYIAGAGLAEGYWHRPELVQEKFVALTFAPEGIERERAYRTGDLVRYLPDGTLQFLGRLDQQVKVRGYRIELGEIEVALREQAAVRDAVVTAGGCDHERLIAYVCLRPGARCDAATLRTHLAQRLPAYMLPSSYVMLDTFPMTPNGKVQRNALPGPTSDDRCAMATPVEPVNEIEHCLAEIYAKVLGITHVGREDDFFALGGHSLMAARMQHSILAHCGVELALSDLFLHPTVAELAQKIAASLTQQSQEEQMVADVLTQLESLSEEEAMQMLAHLPAR
jgi:amino acid adenylation domain-containing protein